MARIGFRTHEKSNLVCSLALICLAVMCGGADRDRTGDPLLAKQVLSQLSYSPSLDCADTKSRRCEQRRGSAPTAKWWVWEELNFRPHPYQGCALTN